MINSRHDPVLNRVWSAVHMACREPSPGIWSRSHLLPQTDSSFLRRTMFIHLSKASFKIHHFLCPQKLQDE